jgi:hypothetical protein
MDIYKVYIVNNFYFQTFHCPCKRALLKKKNESKRNGLTVPLDCNFCILLLTIEIMGFDVVYFTCCLSILILVEELKYLVEACNASDLHHYTPPAI